MSNRKSRYLTAAANCIRLAQMVRAAKRSTLMDMAATWMRLADQAEKNAQVYVVYEPPTDPPVPADLRRDPTRLSGLDSRDQA